MKGFFKKSETFQQYEKARDKEVNEDKEENERVNKELKEMKDKFKHLMADYVALKKRVRGQDSKATKLGQGTFVPEKQQSFNKETARGMEESRNLVGAPLPAAAPKSA